MASSKTAFRYLSGTVEVPSISLKALNAERISCWSSCRTRGFLKRWYDAQDKAVALVSLPAILFKIFSEDPETYSQLDF